MVEYPGKSRICVWGLLQSHGFSCWIFQAGVAHRVTRDHGFSHRRWGFPNNFPSLSLKFKPINQSTVFFPLTSPHFTELKRCLKRGSVLFRTGNFIRHDGGLSGQDAKSSRRSSSKWLHKVMKSCLVAELGWDINMLRSIHLSDPKRLVASCGRDAVNKKRAIQRTSSWFERVIEHELVYRTCLDFHLFVCEFVSADLLSMI